METLEAVVTINIYVSCVPDTLKYAIIPLTAVPGRCCYWCYPHLTDAETEAPKGLTKPAQSQAAASRQTRD